MLCIIHTIAQEQLLGKKHSQITLNIHQPTETACDLSNKNIRLLLQSLALQPLVTFASLSMLHIRDSQKTPSCHTTGMLKLLSFMLTRITSLILCIFQFHFTYSLLSLVSSFIHWVRALKGKDLRDLFVLLLNNVLCKWISQFAARDLTVTHGAVINSAVTLQINECSCPSQCEWE